MTQTSLFSSFIRKVLLVLSITALFMGLFLSLSAVTHAGGGGITTNYGPTFTPTQVGVCEATWPSSTTWSIIVDGVLGTLTLSGSTGTLSLSGQGIVAVENVITMDEGVSFDVPFKGRFGGTFQSNGSLTGDYALYISTTITSSGTWSASTGNNLCTAAPSGGSGSCTMTWPSVSTWNGESNGNTNVRTFRTDGTGTVLYDVIGVLEKLTDVVVTGSSVSFTRPLEAVAGYPIESGYPGVPGWVGLPATPQYYVGVVHSDNSMSGTFIQPYFSSTPYTWSADAPAGTLTCVPTVLPKPTSTFSASPTAITGSGNTTLGWSSTDATSCTGTGFNTGGNTSGSATVPVSVSTTYTLNCTGGGGGVTKNATVIVTPLPTSAPTVTFSASPTSITGSGNSTLAWSSTDANFCSGSGFSTGNSTSGSQSVSVSNTTTYTVSCSGDGGSTSRSVTVTVTQASNQNPTCSAGGDITINTGKSATFSCSATDPDGTISSYSWNFGDGSTSNTQNPTHTYNTAGTYTATCTATDDRGGKDTDTTIVTVTDPKLGADLIANAPVVNGTLVEGSNVTFTGITTNQGDTNVTATFDGLFQIDVNNNGTYDINIEVLNSITNLNAGSSRSVTSPAWSNVPVGTHKVRYCADLPGNDVTESNENNNCSANSEEFKVTTAVVAVPSCSIGQSSGRIFVNLGTESVLANQSAASSQKGPFAVNLPQGMYTVTLESFDDHLSKGGEGQLNEQWHLELNNGGVIATTGTINDLPANQNTLIQVVDTELAVSVAVSSVTAVHSFYPDSLVNSIIPLCAAFDPIVVPSPQCSDGIDNDGDGQTDYPADLGCTSGSDGDEELTVTFVAKPTNNIEGGKSTTLDWESAGANSCTGTGFSTGNSTSGIISVSPTEDTLYSVTCGGLTKKITVFVNWPAAGLDFSAKPLVVPSGNNTTLEWNVSNIASCTITGSGVFINIDDTNLIGSRSVGPITRVQTYTLSCEGLNNIPDSDSVTVRVLPSTFEEF